MVSFSSASSRETCEPRCEIRLEARGQAVEAVEADEGLAEHLFFGKARSAVLARRVFERCCLPVRGEGYVFVRLRLRSEGETPILQVVAEPNDGAPMTVADCATLSRFLSHVLEGEGLVSERTRLEVSSPGLERPLTRLSDFRRFAGAEVALETDRKSTENDWPRSFRATLLGVEGQSVVVQRAEERWAIPVEALVKARLVAVFASDGAAKPSGFGAR